MTNKPDRIIIDFPSQGIKESIVTKQNQHNIDHLACMLRETDASTFYDEFRFFLFKEYISDLQDLDWKPETIKDMVNQLLDKILEQQPQ